MKKLIVIALLLTGCATDASRAYEAARYEANPSYADASNETTMPDIPSADSYTPKDRNMLEYFACLFRHNQRFSSADSRYICQ